MCIVGPWEVGCSVVFDPATNALLEVVLQVALLEVVLLVALLEVVLPLDGWWAR